MKIRQLAVVSQAGVAVYEVDNAGITEITEVTKEYPSHTDHIFVMKNKAGKVLKKIINCPVDISYKQPKTNPAIVVPNKGIIVPNN